MLKIVKMLLNLALVGSPTLRKWLNVGFALYTLTRTVDRARADAFADALIKAGEDGVITQGEFIGAVNRLQITKRGSRSTP